MTYIKQDSFASEIAVELGGEKIKGDLKVRCPICQGTTKKKYARMITNAKGNWTFQCPAWPTSIPLSDLIMKHGSPSLRDEWDSAWKAVTQRRTATKENPFEKPMAIMNRRR